VETYRAQGASSRISGFACITAVLLGIAIIPQPNLAEAADGKGGGATTLSVMRGPGSDRSDLSEAPAAGGSVVMRGTGPPRPNASQPSPGAGGEGYAGTNNAFQQVPNNTFQPWPLYGSGWDRRYDYGGLSSPGSGLGW
jgi:hypothetical protein